MHTAIITAESLSILYLLVLLFSVTYREEKQRTSIAFIICLVVAIVGVATDLLSYVMEYTSASPFWLTTINMLSFLGYDFELMAFAMYVWTMVAEKGDVSRSFAQFNIMLCAVDILFVVVGTFTGKLFLIENGKFVDGPWYNLGGVMGFVILVSLLIFAVKKRKTVGIRPLVITAIFFVITYTSIFITLFTGVDSYMYVCMSLIMLLVYIILQTGEIEQGHMREHIMFEMSTTDILTNLNNRRAYENALDKYMDIANFGVIFCDANGLKATNDTLGHAAGDALLQCVSNLLEKHFSHSDIFRISGDEFVVLRPNVDEDVFISEVGKLKKAIAEQKDIASIGHAFGKGSAVLELVSKAEKDMYSDKKTYYERHGLNRRKA